MQLNSISIANEWVCVCVSCVYMSLRLYSSATRIYFNAIMTHADMTQGSLTHAPCTDSHSFIKMQFLCNFLHKLLPLFHSQTTIYENWKLRETIRTTDDWIVFHHFWNTISTIHIDDSILLMISVRTEGRMTFDKDRRRFSRNTFDDFKAKAIKRNNRKKIQ